jgi:hypothetical protein
LKRAQVFRPVDIKADARIVDGDLDKASPRARDQASRALVTRQGAERG